MKRQSIKTTETQRQALLTQTSDYPKDNQATTW